MKTVLNRQFIVLVMGFALIGLTGCKKEPVPPPPSTPTTTLSSGNTATALQPSTDEECNIFPLSASAHSVQRATY